MTTTELATVSGRFQAKLDPILREVSARSYLLSQHPRTEDAYRTLVRTTYPQIRASVPLMITAATVASEQSATDPVSAGMLDWLHEHTEEERNHDEWLLDDWAVIGGDPDSLRAAPGSPSVAAMVGSVYYWILHAHPIAVLGYCAVLEGNPPTTQLIDRFAKGSGLPERAFSTLRHHSNIDDDHSSEIYELMDALPLTDRHEAIMGMTALQTADLMIQIGDDMLASLPTH
jgi:hypothetical protein